MKRVAIPLTFVLFDLAMAARPSRARGGGLLRFALCLQLLCRPAWCRSITPPKRYTALKLLRNLAREGSADEISIDIGGTLAKVRSAGVTWV